MIVCPVKTNKLWILLEKQVGEDKAYAIWFHNGFNYPASLRNTPTLHKDLGFKSEISWLQYKNLQKRINKYNRDNKTSHVPIIKSYNHRLNLYDMELGINYLPKDVTVEMVMNDRSIYSKEEYKAIINNNSDKFVGRDGIDDIFINSGTEFIRNGNAYASYEDAIKGEDSMPIGNKEGLDFVFKESSELRDIGTQEQYSQYLGSVFPDSKVKDIVYHGGKEKIEVFDATKSKVSNVLYFSNDLDEAKHYGGDYSTLTDYTTISYNGFLYKSIIKDNKHFYLKKIIGGPVETLTKDEAIAKYLTTEKEYKEAVDSYNKTGVVNSVIVNISNLYNGVGKDMFFGVNVKFKEKYDGFITNNDGGQPTIIGVLNPNQIHILGSKQDIKGFKDFVSNKNIIGEDAMPDGIVRSDKVLAENYENFEKESQDMNSSFINNLENADLLYSYYKIKELKIDSLDLSKKSKGFSDNASDYLKEDIKNGQKTPILINGRGEVVEGWHRIHSIKANGGTTIKAYVPIPNNIIGEDSLPDGIVGDKKNLKPKFQEVADLYSAKVQLLRKTIGRLNEQKKGASFEEKLKLETRINGLKQSIQNLIGDKNDASVKGKIDNILKLNAIEDIEPFANEQLSEVEKIFTQDNISEEELEYARKVVSTWITAGDFSGKDTLFFDEDELESIDDDLVDIKNKFVGWRNRAERIQRKFIIPLEVNKVAEGINKTFNTNITDFETVVEDVTGLKAATLDISEVNHPILQAMMGWVKIANYHAHMEADEVANKLDELLDKVSNLDWDLFQQRFSNADSRKTGNLTFRFSQQYYDAVSNVFDEANAIKNNPQLRNRKFNEAIEFLRKNTIIFDVRKLFPDEELWGTQYTGEENEAHVRKLKETLGEIGYEEFYKKAEEKAEEYKLDKEAYLTHLEATEDSSAQIAAEMDAWEKNNSPAYEANIIEVGGTKEKVAGKFVNPTGRYSVKIPQKMVGGKDTGYYDSNFAKIEADENTRNLYNHIFRTLNDLKQYLPYDETKWMHINSLPTIPLTILEEFGKDKLHRGLSPVWDELKRATTISDISTESKKPVNLVTGEPDKELQTQYLIDYNEQIEKQLQLAVIQFVQDNIRNPNAEEYINLKRDISHKIAQEKTFDLGKVTKAYTHMALTYKHKSAIQDVMKAGEAIVKRQIEQMQTNSGEPKTRFWKALGKKGGLDNINGMLDTFMTMYWGYGMDKPFGKGGKVYTSKEIELKKQLEIIKEQNEQDLKDGTITDREYEAIESLVTDQLEVLGGIRAYSKYGDMILKYIQLKGMGWNVFAGLTNMTFGFVANLIEASDGRNYTNQDFWKAQAAVLNTIGGYNRFSEKGKKISALMSKLDVLKTSKNELYKSTKLGLSKKLDKVGKVVNPYTPQASTEYINQAVVMMAMMYNTKVIVDGVETNLFDAYDNNGNLKEGVEFVNKEYNTDLFKVRLDKIIKMNHGNYDSEAPLSIKRHMWGRALVQFKTWALQGFAERFMDELPDIQLGITRKGRYRSYASYYKTMQENGTGWIPATFNITKQLLRKATFGKYNTQFDEVQGLSEVDAANMRKNMTEIMTLISITVLTLLIKAAFVDDEDKNFKYIAYFWINQLNRLNTDMSFYTSPLAFEKLQQNTIPAFSLVTDTQKALVASWNLINNPEKDILKQGDNKGQSKTFRAWNRVITTPVGAYQKLKSATESVYADKPVR